MTNQIYDLLKCYQNGFLQRIFREAIHRDFLQMHEHQVLHFYGISQMGFLNTLKVQEIKVESP